MTKAFERAMNSYRDQLKQGEIQVAYRGLMDFFRDLRVHFAKTFPSYSISRTIYFGYMDMTYFAVVPPALEANGLKIAVVFLHEPFHFQVWLSGVNRGVQETYWQKLNQLAGQKFRLAVDPRKEDFILSSPLVGQPDFSDLDKLMVNIERGVVEFIGKMEAMLAKMPG